MSLLKGLRSTGVAIALQETSESNEDKAEKGGGGEEDADSEVRKILQCSEGISTGMGRGASVMGPGLASRS